MNRESSPGDGSLERAIQALRGNRPLVAEEICRDYLLLHPGSLDHLRLLGHSLTRQRRFGEAEAQIRAAIALHDDYPQLHQDLGSVLASQGRRAEAIAQFERALRIEPSLQLARKLLAQALASSGRGAEADELFIDYFSRDADREALLVGAEHARSGRTDDAVAAFKNVLKRSPDNVDAMRFLALVWQRDASMLSDAEALLRRATALTPDYAAAVLNLGAVLVAQGKRLEAVDAFGQAVRLEPDNPQAWAGLGNAYALASNPEQAVAAYARATTLDPTNEHAQVGYAHVLKAVGSHDASVAAYRAAIAIRPGFGEAYWSMANLKTFRFGAADIQAMEEQVTKEGLSDGAAVHFRFALGKAHEDRGDFDRAWQHFDAGNRRKRPSVYYDPLEMELRMNSLIEVFNESFLQARGHCGFEATDPIFIVGLPRSGSTLIEQILASHSQVEGTAELPNLGTTARSIGRYRADRKGFPESVRDLRDRDWRGFGKQYLDETGHLRLTGRPFFTDKLPNNFSLIGFLQLILPNAKVINARRHPLDSLLGNYKQLYGKGQDFSYDLVDLAEYYRQYDRIMKHWHRVLPGKILDVHYEETVLDLEGQVRRILAHCGLPYEAACLSYHRNERSVKTASSEQVRRPIYTDALGTWRRYAHHLGLWQEELADILEELPATVRNAGA